MNEREIVERSLKLSVFKSFPYETLKQVCDAICELGFCCEFIDNGDIVFMELKVIKNERKIYYIEDLNEPSGKEN